MKFAASVTLYNPNESQIEHVLEYKNSFDVVFLFDNTESGNKKDLLSLPENCVLLNENRNCGLPYAFNKTIEDPRTQATDFLCTLDQDSTFKKEDIASIKKYLEKSDDVEKIGIIAPFVNYGYGKHKKTNEVESKKWVITSGAFVNLNVIRKEKMTYDNAYFIDKCDIDICQQMLSRGYKVLVYHGAELFQTLGEYNGHKHPNHSTLRHYYLFRNRFYFNNKWFGKWKCIVLDVLQTLKHVCLIILYENDRKNKLKVLPRAFIDYKKNNMGNCLK